MNIDDFSVIVPTKNEICNIPALLQSIPPEVRLIVVDASTDETPNLISRLRPRNTHVILSPASIAEARNLGAQAASTPYFVFSDADVIFSPGYFRRLCMNPPFAAIYGPKLAMDDQRPYYQKFSRWQARFDRLGIPAVSGSNLVVRANVFSYLSGFKTDLLVNEDTELGYRLKKNSFPVQFDPRLVVYARDHRRLRRGKLRKDLHTLARCALIYMDVMPALWSGRDWGYWSK
jgi:glycosyltransferase involved in cell wall biosynthesis